MTVVGQRSVFFILHPVQFAGCYGCDKGDKDWDKVNGRLQLLKGKLQSHHRSV